MNDFRSNSDNVDESHQTPEDEQQSARLESSLSFQMDKKQCQQLVIKTTVIYRLTTRG